MVVLTVAIFHCSTRLGLPYRYATIFFLSPYSYLVQHFSYFVFCAFPAFEFSIIHSCSISLSSTVGQTLCYRYSFVGGHTHRSLQTVNVWQTIYTYYEVFLFEIV